MLTAQQKETTMTIIRALGDDSSSAFRDLRLANDEERSVRYALRCFWPGKKGFRHKGFMVGRRSQVRAPITRTRRAGCVEYTVLSKARGTGNRRRDSYFECNMFTGDLVWVFHAFGRYLSECWIPAGMVPHTPGDVFMRSHFMDFYLCFLEVINLTVEDVMDGDAPAWCL